jgi:hypothetical protein
MRPRQVSRRTPPVSMQLSLLLPAPRVTALAPEARAGVVAALARLLLEAAGSTPASEGGDEDS